MRKSLFILLFLVFLTPLSSFANQFYAGVGMTANSGQPDFDVDRIPFTVGLELENVWRFTLTDVAFEHEDDGDQTIKSRIITAEAMWIHELDGNLSLTGSFGPGFFQTKASLPGNSATGYTFGISAAGSVRYKLDESMFFDAAYHYKNASVVIEDTTVDGGYQGLFVNFGLSF